MVNNIDIAEHENSDKIQALACYLRMNNNQHDLTTTVEFNT